MTNKNNIYLENIRISTNVQPLYKHDLHFLVTNHCQSSIKKLIANIYSPICFVCVRVFQ